MTDLIKYVFQGNQNELSEISLNGTVYDFSVDHILIKKKTFLTFTNI